MKRSALRAEERALAPVVQGAEPEIVPHPAKAPSDAGVAFRIAALAKAFGARALFHGLSLEIAAGECIAVVGRSGSGKTCLLRMIAGIETADAGEIEIGGKPIAGPRGDVGLLFPEPRLLPWHRAIANVGIARGANWRARAQAALADVGLDDRANDWPAALSAGERQRIALARALVRRPKALLMDEPFAALDAAARAELHKRLIRLHRQYGFTGLFITRDAREALALADRVAVLRDGDIVLDERINVPLELRTASPRLRHLEHRILAEI